HRAVRPVATAAPAAVRSASSPVAFRPCIWPAAEPPRPVTSSFAPRESTTLPSLPTDRNRAPRLTGCHAGDHCVAVHFRSAHQGDKTMNYWAKRSLQGALVAGGLWAIGAGIASADSTPSTPATSGLNLPITAPVDVG